ncbi:MAG: chemotaxis protein CheD [Clostridiales bacterium]|jgi:chemotaxis protein CheD|nr:chemotaxis protein CheD [Clostridiales bacterium]
MRNDKIIVGMADLNAVKSPGVLTTLGLGSCVGIALYDSVNKIAGLAHIMLPDSTQVQNNSNAAKFADTATIRLIYQMRRLGARKELLKAKIAGGAQMFDFHATNEALRIGDRNVVASLKFLEVHGIPVIARDTGLNYGRTVELYAEDGKYLIKTIGHGSRFI